MLEKATNAFQSKVEEINSINYFPVIDHDTGINMYGTLRDSLVLAHNDIHQLINKLIVSSKGNSGLILSKAIIGFLSVLLQKKILITNEDITAAVIAARNNAYAAVLYPKEGTMLTFLDILADNFYWDDRERLVSLFEKALEQTFVDGEYDAGAKGLYYLIEFAFELGLNKSIAVHTIDVKKKQPSLKYKYCTEFVIQCRNIQSDYKAFIEKIGSLGDSIAYSYLGDLLKVHVHNNNPFEIFALASELGVFLYKKIDNMSLENGEMHPIVFIVDDNDDLFSPFLKYDVEYISLSSFESSKEIAHKMDSICAEKVILLTNKPSLYEDKKYDRLYIVQTYGLLSKVTALLCRVNMDLAESIEDMQDYARIYKDGSYGDDEVFDEEVLTESQIMDLFAFPPQSSVI